MVARRTYLQDARSLEKRLKALDTALTKYRPDQARGEKGTPQGGRFVEEGGGGSGGGSGGSKKPRGSGGSSKPRWKPDGSSNWSDADHARDFESRRGVSRSSSKEEIAEALRSEDDDSGYDPGFDGPRDDPHMDMLSRRYGFRNFSEVRESEPDKSSFFDRVRGAFGRKPKKGK